MEKVKLSVIIPVYNGENKIEKCLKSIRIQDYPQDLVDIIIVDDDSTDRTVEIAMKYGCRIVRNGSHDPERGKSIGIENSIGEYLFFIDDDNIIPHNKWLSRLVSAVVKENCIGGQVAKFTYLKDASISDQYMALFGSGDPAVYYLQRRDHMKKTEKEWELGGKVQKETKDYFKVKFDAETLPTIGSQGFLIKKEYVEMIDWKPFFYHIDSNYELVKKGYDEYIILKDSIIHNHSKDFKDFMKKIKRNSNQLAREDQYRTYSYHLSIMKLLKLGLTLGTVIIPLKDSLVGFMQYPSKAWFLHPIICFRVALIYTWNVLKDKNAVKKIK